MFPDFGNPGYGYDGLLYSSHGTLSLTPQSPAQIFAEPLTVAEVRTYLNLPLRSPVDAEEDDTLAGFISAAREVAEIAQGRDLVRKQWDLTLDYFPSWAVRLRSPLISVDLVSYRDSGGNATSLVGATDYLVDTNRQPGIITPVYNGFWPIFTPNPSSAVLVRFTSGYSATDAFWNDSGRRLKVGMKLLISMWYNNRLPFEAVSSISEYPYAVTALLEYGSLPRSH